MKYNAFSQNIKSKMQDSAKKIPFEVVRTGFLSFRKTKKRSGGSGKLPSGTVQALSGPSEIFLQPCGLQNRFRAAAEADPGVFPR